MPSFLESRHRLLHLRASLESKWSQPRYPSMDIGSSLNSKIMSLRRCDFMAIDLGKTQEQRDHHIVHNLRKRYLKRGSEGIHDRLPRRSRISWISTRTWSNWRSLYPDGQGRVERFHLSNHARRVLSIQKELVDLSLNKSGKIGPVRDRSGDFNDALTTSSRLHQESQKRQLRPIPFGKYQQWHPSNKFFHQHLVAMERFLVELMTISKKVSNRAHANSDMIEREDPLWVPSFHKTSDVATFKIFSFLIVQIVYSW